MQEPGLAADSPPKSRNRPPYVDDRVTEVLRTDPASEVDVLIVLRATQPDLSPMLDRSTLSNKFIAPILPDEAAIERARVRCEKAMRDVGADVLNWLPNAQTFVARLSLRQLEALLKTTNEIAEVLPNLRTKSP